MAYYMKRGACKESVNNVYKKIIYSKYGLNNIREYGYLRN